MEKIKALGSEDIVANNIERLKELFPTIFSEGKLVVEELQALLGDYVEKDKEFYQMTWAGKTQAKKEANKVSTGTLRPNKADSKNWDTTGNIFIEGDNLEVLKLLQKTYSNKIKMIYIDPPYNTGKDFIYKDNYKDNLTNYLELTGQTDAEGKKISTNTDSDGRYHSNWLNMMYPRLKLARNLLTDDGVIFISIDDNEQANLKKLCDEIFGEENFQGNISWLKKRKGSFLTKGIISVTEYILVYSKNKELKLFGGKPDESESQPLVKRTNPLNVLRFPSNSIFTKLKDEVFSKGVYGEGTSSVELIEDTEVKNGIFIKEVILKGNFIWSQNMVDQQIILGAKFVINTTNFQVRVFKIYENEAFKGVLSFINGVDNRSTNEDGYEQLRDIFTQEGILDYPKPLNLIKGLLTNGTYFDKNAKIIDFFSGSGTTAHAVMALNAEDGGNRKCISVQLPEPTDEKSEAYKAKFYNIADITKERIRRAGKLIKQKNKDKENIDKLDVGFRAFKLDSSNIRAWDTSVDKFEGQLDAFLANNGDSIKAGRTEEDVLFEIILKYGLDLTLPIQEKQIDGCTIYNIGFGAMYICLSDRINISVAVAIGEWHKDSSDSKPSVIFKDAGFANDADKTNTIQTLRQAGIENVKSI